MHITFDRPLFGTGKTLAIHVNDEKRGSMKRWFRSHKQRASTDLRHDVNIDITAEKNQFSITQVKAALQEASEWAVERNGVQMTKMTSAKGLNAKHRIDANLENQTDVCIEAGLQRKADLYLNGQKIGTTEAKGFLLNSRYVIEVESDIPEEIDPALLAGMTYAFWCSF
ncbi:hypothetical protein [Salisediminibacterium beveridgei]|uniref:Uncharacterized protein n=1 Tax=Salisediminibacterium beveridgei TaxID=632773 RepID=A0A1D7QZ31_9BACI|nr:hypothetical protein [Salisediminibacterium beveridgei]AOM84276.1 hypothetical protein BBEV_2951 [Salisediminibacterium beveridgei]